MQCLINIDAQPRIAFLFGTTTPDGGVRVETIYEPAQILDELEEMVRSRTCDTPIIIPWPLTFPLTFGLLALIYII